MVRDQPAKKRGRPRRVQPANIGETNQHEPIKVPHAVEVPQQSNVKVVFLHVGEDLTLPNLMVASVLKAMPGAEIVQMTDMVTPLVKGASSIIRKPYNGKLMTFRMQHLAELKGEWITLDTDVIVKKDLRPIFIQEFDVALTKRTGQILDQDGIDIVALMPYNTGVMFSRNHQFWKLAYKSLLDMPEQAHKWWGDQLCVRLTADSARFNVLELDCNEYNYSPNSEQDNKDCHVLHFKGKRKDWMINGHNQLL